MKWLNADRSALANECLEIERAGGSVRDFLRCAGFISPWGTWWRLQKEELLRKSNQLTDGKGGELMRKITLEQKQKAVEIAIGGGDPLAWLNECGSKNPQALWYAIRKTLKDANPEKYGQLPGSEKEEPEMVEKIEETVKETVEIRSDVFDVEVIAVRDPALGRFSWEEKPGVMYWRTDDGEEVCLTPDEWRKLAERLPKIMRVLGI